MSGDLGGPPWRTTGTWLVYAHPGLCLHEHEVVRRGGGTGTCHRLAEHASTRVVAVDADGQLAVVWHWRYSLGAPSVELPSAPVEPGQDPVVAARRALRDGCGLAAAHWTRTGTVTAATGVAAQPVHLYRAERVHRTLRPAGDREHDREQQGFTLPYEVAVGSAVTGAIAEAASAAALLHAEQHRLAGQWHLPGSQPPHPPTSLFRL